MKDQTRPDRTTMEGMIWNANHVLDIALSPDTKGIPRDLVKKCKGVVLISVVEAGFMFSGNVGTGVVMAQQDDGTWSAPSALGLAGIGFGFMVGAEVKDIVIIMMDDSSVRAMSGDHQIKVGGQASVTVGPVGREAEVAFNLSTEGVGASFSYTFSKGLFGGIALESAVLGARAKENERFYGKKATTPEILFGEAVEIPKGKGIEELHEKLNLLQAGETLVLNEADAAKKESLRELAESVGTAAKVSQTDVVEVNAAEEAKKE